MMVHFRKRISPEALGEINLAIISRSRKESEPPQDPPAPPPSDQTPDTKPGTQPEAEPNGKLLIDATCTPADITYPTDLKLLNDAREKTERILQVSHLDYVKQVT